VPDNPNTSRLVRNQSIWLLIDDPLNKLIPQVTYQLSMLAMHPSIQSVEIPCFPI
jgi:hypothetical protein